MTFFLVTGLGLLSLYVLWLDNEITKRFSGRRWQIPASVYASPVEIYIGQSLSQTSVGALLDANGYRHNRAVHGPGEYSIDGEQMVVYFRAFNFPDEQRPARKIRIGFRDSIITSIHDSANRQDIAIFTLEPELIGKIYPESYEDRVLLKYEDVPESLIHGLIAVEDRQFYQHHGIDLRGIARAAIANIRSASISQGGSTLTQQLVKNYFLSRERTLQRKLNEVIMALVLEFRFSKQEILTAYCNEVFLGQQGRKSIHGFGTAAEFYFGRPLQELNNHQIALLIAMVKGASYFNPRRHPQRARERRNLVLSQMYAYGHVSEQELQQGQKAALGVTKKARWSFSRYPAFIQLVRRQLLEEYELEDLRTEGLQIHTSLDVQLQQIIRKNSAVFLRQIEPDNQADPVQAATVFLDHSSGAILALSASRDPDIVGFNRAIEAQRHIGSLVKPFIYYSALVNNPQWRLTDRISDGEIRIRQADGSDWQPENYDGIDHGDISLIEALTRSYNRATVRLGINTGTKQLVTTLENLGINERIKVYDSVLLGAVNLSPLQVAQMYQALANGGFSIPLTTIRDVLDDTGAALTRNQIQLKQTLLPEQAFLVNYLLQQTTRVGTARQLQQEPALRDSVAGKTGTSNDLRDSWFAGYSDRITGIVWMGRDGNSPADLTGATGAMQLWKKIMAQRGVSPLTLVAPPGIQWQRNIRIDYAGECVEFAQVPYLGNAKPQSDPHCLQ